MTISTLKEICEKEMGRVYHAIGEASRIRQADIKKIVNQLHCSSAIVIYEDLGRPPAENGVSLPARGELSIYVDPSELSYQRYLKAIGRT